MGLFEFWGFAGNKKAMAKQNGISRNPMGPLGTFLSFSCLVFFMALTE